MATSGSINYNLTATELVNDAYQHLAVLEAGETMSDAQLQVGLRALNKMIKAWQAQDLHIWTLQEATLLLTKGATSYSFPTADCSDTVIQTTLSAAEASGQTVISVTSSTGMTAADNVCIEMDDGTLHCTTIVSVDSSTQITITVATDDDAASGNYLYTYTNKINRPLGITEARHVLADGNETPMWLFSRNDYMLLPEKTTEGSTNQVYFDRQLSTGVLYTWPTAESVRNRIKFTYKRSIEDFDNTSDDPDLPAEWLECITFNLALRLSFGELVPGDVMAGVAQMAASLLKDMKEFDSEDEAVTFELDYEG